MPKRYAPLASIKSSTRLKRSSSSSSLEAGRCAAASVRHTSGSDSGSYCSRQGPSSYGRGEEAAAGGEEGEEGEVEEVGCCWWGLSLARTMLVCCHGSEGLRRRTLEEGEGQRARAGLMWGREVGSIVQMQVGKRPRWVLLDQCVMLHVACCSGKGVTRTPRSMWVSPGRQATQSLPACAAGGPACNTGMCMGVYPCDQPQYSVKRRVCLPGATRAEGTGCVSLRQWRVRIKTRRVR